MSRLGVGVALVIAAGIAVVAALLASFTPPAAEASVSSSVNMGLIWFAAGTLVLVTLLAHVLRMKLRSRQTTAPSQLPAESLVAAA